jgi:hypothetical protein
MGSWSANSPCQSANRHQLDPIRKVLIAGCTDTPRKSRLRSRRQKRTTTSQPDILDAIFNNDEEQN